MRALALALVLAAGPLPALSTVELALRVLGAVVLGGLVGLERELSGRPAGFRTHILVSLGACLFTMAGAYGVAGLGAGGTNAVDPTRVAAQVVSGIGFLGAGAILRTGESVQGLTTAAALWVTAAIGLAVGLGYWPGAIAVAGATLLALYGLKRVERGSLKRFDRGRCRFVIDPKPGLTLADLTAAVEANSGRIETIRMENDESGGRRVEVLVRLPRHGGPGPVGEALGALDGVSAVDWTS